MPKKSSQPLVFLAFALGASALSPAYGQYTWSIIEPNGNTVWSSSVTQVSFADFGAGAFVYAELTDPNRNILDSGFDENLPPGWEAQNLFYVEAEVDLEASTDGPGYYTVTADNWEYYLPIEDWIYLGQTSAVTNISPPAGPPQITSLSVPSSNYGEDGYIQIMGTNLDPDGCGCVAWVTFCDFQSATDTEVWVYHSPAIVPNTYQVQVETQNSMGNQLSNPLPFVVNGDQTPTIGYLNPLPPWQAGSAFTLTITGSGFGTNPSASPSCCGVSISYPPISSSDTSIVANVTIDPSAPNENVTITVTSTGYNGEDFVPGPQQSNQGTAQAQVTALTPTLTQSPSALNLSTGDTNKYITVNISPSTVNFASTFRTSLYQDPNSSCDAGLTFSGSGSSSVNSVVTVPSAQSNCSGVFSATAYYSSLSGPVDSNTSTTVVVPPQVLIQMMYGEAHNQTQVGDNVSELTIGVAARNRFTQSGFGGVTTWQAALTPSQFQGINTGITNGPSPELSNASAVFTYMDGVSVANAACFFSPTASGWSAIQAALNSGTASLPAVQYDPNCYQANEQLVYKQSVGNNANGSGAPAFIFEQYRSNPSSAPAVIQIP